MTVEDRKQRLFRQREEEILAAALELFSDDNWQSVTIEQIARQAEVGKGTIYKHFAGKDEIYARLAMDFQRQVLTQIDAIAPELGVLAYLREITRIFWDTHMASREQHRVLQYCHQDSFRFRISETTAQAMDALFGELIAPIDATLERGIAEGLFPAKPLPLLMFGAQAALWGAIDKVWTGCAAEESPERYLEEVTRFILAGLMHQDDPTLK